MSKLKLGIVGAGGVSGKHIASAQASGFEIVALVDPNEKMVGTRREKTGVECPDFRDLGAMLDAVEVDAVSLCTPQFTHKDLAVQALEAKKPVLVEKPFCLNAGEAREMAKASKDNDTLLMPVQNYLYHTPFMKAKELLDSGAIGEPRHAEVNWQWAFFMRNSPWRKDAKLAGGGTLIELGVHTYYMARYFMGEIESVTCEMGFREADDMEDSVFTLFQHKGAGMSVVMNSLVGNFDKMTLGDDSITLRGSEGVIRVNGCLFTPFIEPKLSIYKGGKWASVDDYVVLPFEEIFTGMYRNFHDAITGTAEPDGTGEDGLRIMELVDAAYKSAREGVRVAV